MIVKSLPPGTIVKTPIGKLELERSQMHRYPSGKFFITRQYHGLIEAIAKSMHQRIKDGLDAVVCIQGAEGSGKSNLAYQLCKAYDPNFDMSQQYIYSIDDLRRKLAEGDDQHNVFWLDEGSNIANNRNWQTQDNKDIVELLEMMRSRQWVLIFCIPLVDRLDVYIRENRLSYLLTCKPFIFGNRTFSRGIFELDAKTKNGIWRYVGAGSYDKIPEGEKERYEEIKLASQQRRLEKFIERGEKPGAKYQAKYRESQNRMNLAIYKLSENASPRQRKEIAAAFGLNDNMFRQAIFQGKKLAEGTANDEN